VTPNKENIRKWVTALRSGEYQQVKRHLSLNGSYCCLGVACELAIANGVGVKRTAVASIRADGDDDTYVNYDGGMSYMPNSVRKWLGIDCGDPVLTEKIDESGFKSPVTASDMNDREDKTFAEIADAIEQKYLADELVDV